MNGRVNIRPDSGNPVKIICGDKNASEENEEYKLIDNLTPETIKGIDGDMLEEVFS